MIPGASAATGFDIVQLQDTQKTDERAYAGRIDWQFNDLNKILRESAKDQGIDRFIVGGAGHYTGMAPHDVGSLRDPFVAGVVFNIEPLLVVPSENLHIRFEDTVLCTATGQEVLTPLDVLPWEADKLLELRDGKLKR